MLSAVIIGAFLALPLYRPVLVAFNAVPVIYGLFAAVAAIQLIQIRTVAYAGWPGALLLLFATITIFTTAISAPIVRLDLMGLLLFLPLSFLLGLTVWSTQRVTTVMHTILTIFVPVALYVVYQLSIHGFSYNTYMNWSNAAYRINYLDFSLYGVVLLIFFSTRTIALPKRALICVPILLTVLASGGRYSILFLSIFLTYLVLNTIKTPNLRRQATIWMVVAIVVVLVAGGVFHPGDYYQYFEYSMFRMTNALDSDQSISGRLALIDRALSSGLAHFLTGHGLGGSRRVLDGTYPHNFLLEAFLDGGLFAALALVGFCMSAALLPLKHIAREEKWILWLALFIVGAFLKSFSIYEARILFFVLGFLFANYAYRNRRHRQFHAQESRSGIAHRRDRFHDVLHTRKA